MLPAGLPRITAHGLRHGFASAALKARVPLVVVAARLGNTPRMVQEVHAHVIPADDAAQRSSSATSIAMLRIRERNFL